MPSHSLKAIYLNFLIQKAKSSSPVEEAVNALSWVHKVATVEDPTTHLLVGQVLAGAKRLLAKHIVKKEPITPEILGKLVDSITFPSASLSDIRTITICLVGYAGFFRYNELAKLKESDIHIHKDHMEVFVESSKTDHYRDGAWVVIARTNSKLCPVAMMEHYMKKASIQGSDVKFLFRGLVNTKSGTKLRDTGGLSYTRVCEVVLDKLSAIGLDRHQFGLQSLRSGGASAAANAGVPDRCFKRHGRWRSENAKDGYVKDNLKNRLDVTLKLGLGAVIYTMYVNAVQFVS